jgi:hypothetical protein
LSQPGTPPPTPRGHQCTPSTAVGGLMTRCSHHHRPHQRAGRALVRRPAQWVGKLLPTAMLVPSSTRGTGLGGSLLGHATVPQATGSAPGAFKVPLLPTRPPTVLLGPTCSCYSDEGIVQPCNASHPFSLHQPHSSLTAASQQPHSQDPPIAAQRRC